MPRESNARNLPIRYFKYQQNFSNGFFFKYKQKMEEAIANNRGAAEKTFDLTMPKREFRKIGEDSIGIYS